MIDHAANSHSRKNLLTGEWVLVSPQRLERPWQGDVETEESGEMSPHDPDCPLCPGNRRANDTVNPDYTGPFVFDNDFPAISISDEVPGGEQPVFESRRENGYCKVVCYSERHDLRLSTMLVEDVRDAFARLCAEYAALECDDEIAYVQVFENRGKMMGCSNLHPHVQIWATEHLPTEIGKELHEQGHWFAVHNRPLLADYYQAELDDGARIVTTSEHFVALVPFWATWPFETMILPRRNFAAPTEMTTVELSAFAEISQSVLAAGDHLFDTSLPYSMGWHPRPCDGEEHPEWIFHAHLYPPLLRSATIRKHMVGFEMLAMPQRDITPEVAAAKLREYC